MLYTAIDGGKPTKRSCGADGHRLRRCLSRSQLCHASSSHTSFVSSSLSSFSSAHHHQSRNPYHVCHTRIRRTPRTHGLVCAFSPFSLDPHQCQSRYHVCHIRMPRVSRSHAMHSGCWKSERFHRIEKEIPTSTPNMSAPLDLVPLASPRNPKRLQVAHA